jgi:hypothetical protein
LETVLTLTQDRCKVCAEHTTGLETVFGHTGWNLNLISVHLETVLV